MIRDILHKLLMLDPGYRKAARVERTLIEKTEEIKAAIKRTDELKISIDSAKNDLAGFVAREMSAARPVDRTEELKSAIESMKDEFKISMESVKNDLAGVVAREISAARPVDRTEELKSSIESAKNDLAGFIAREIAAARPVDRTDELKSVIEAVRVALFRNDIRCRWQVLDALDGLLYPPSTRVRCPVCGHEAAKSDYATRISECIFGGGRLERFVCPDCDCIFGPLKMMALDGSRLGEEYRQSYSVYSESDCSVLEERAFRELHPSKSGVYLNYGAGAWNKTTEKLRAEGYQVYDFEPYAPAEAREWVLRSKDEVGGLKFDGIFSNDLIEHLPDPIEELRFMGSVLKPDGRMVHCTGCYEYAFEHTRFHLFFFTGRSLSVVADKSGFTAALQNRLNVKSPARLCVFTKKRNPD